MTDRWIRGACPRFGTMACVAIIAVALAIQAQADEEAGPEDLALITEALRAAGYSSFEEVEFDDGVWEVDDAIGSDGREYDLELDPDTLEIIDIEED